MFLTYRKTLKSLLIIYKLAWEPSFALNNKSPSTLIQTIVFIKNNVNIRMVKLENDL